MGGMLALPSRAHLLAGASPPSASVVCPSFRLRWSPGWLWPRETL